eukprot:COSAG01_NODE_7309_length_3257_cov_5.117163_1_plen_90_part_00
MSTARWRPSQPQPRQRQGQGQGQGQRQGQRRRDVTSIIAQLPGGETAVKQLQQTRAENRQWLQAKRAEEAAKVAARCGETSVFAAATAR